MLSLGGCFRGCAGCGLFACEHFCFPFILGSVLGCVFLIFCGCCKLAEYTGRWFIPRPQLSSAVGCHFTSEVLLLNGLQCSGASVVRGAPPVATQSFDGAGALQDRRSVLVPLHGVPGCGLVGHLLLRRSALIVLLASISLSPLGSSGGWGGVTVVCSAGLAGYP